MTGPVTVAFKPDETATGAPHETFLDAGHNPPDGVVIYYFLKQKPDGDVTLTILDADGNEVRSFSSGKANGAKPPVEPGMHRFIWDMRGAPPTKMESGDTQDRFEQMMEAGVAPRVLPGTYQVRLQAGDIEQTQTFEIVQDPRVKASDEDLREQFELKSSIRDELSGVNDALNQLRKIRKQVEAWEDRTKEDESASAVATAAGGLKDALNDIEAQLVNVDSSKPQPGAAQVREKLVTLSMMIDESDDRPTAGAREVFGMLADQVESLQARVRQVLDADLRSLNDKIQAAKLPTIAP
jgi:hypothetical protein